MGLESNPIIFDSAAPSGDVDPPYETSGFRTTRPPGGDQFPNPATTGTPSGWTPASTRSTDLTVTTDGAVVEDIRFTDGAGIVVRANNVTIRRVDLHGGVITNQYGSAPEGCVRACWSRTRPWSRSRAISSRPTTR
jgi:hypothetical protein